MAISNGYTTLNEVKSALNLEDSLENGGIELAIATASRMIDDYCGRFFYQDGTSIAPATRYYTPQDFYTVAVDDFVSLSEIATDDKEIEETLFFYPLIGAINNLSTHLSQLTQVNNCVQNKQINLGLFKNESCNIGKIQYKEKFSSAIGYYHYKPLPLLLISH